MKTIWRSTLLTAGLLCLSLLVVAPAGADEEPTELSREQQEVVEQILELRRQIDLLLQSLPEEIRQEVERRLAQEAAGPAATVAEDEVAAPSAGHPEFEAAPEDEVAVAVVSESEFEIPEPAAPCGGFHLFDTNQDTLITAADRQWRFLRLWFDADGNSVIDESEIESLFDLGIRQIDQELRSYGTADSSSEDVDVDGVIWLRQAGGGKRDRQSGVLIVDADRLTRDGRLWLTDADGVQLTGFRALAEGAFLETREGERHPVLCPGVEAAP